MEGRGSFFLYPHVNQIPNLFSGLLLAFTVSLRLGLVAMY